MNIFVLDINPRLAASYHCDKHVVKMIVETAQILSSVHHYFNCDENWMYKQTHKNHPCNIWARSCLNNYNWLCSLGIELCEEYKIRYGKTHKTTEKIKKLLETKPRDLTYKSGVTYFPLAMPEHCKIYSDNNIVQTVESYRNYYKIEKAYFAKWKNGNIPHWFLN